MADSEQPSGAPVGAQASPRLGQILRDARVAQDLTIEQLSAELRIEAPQLAALEENRFEKIGVPVFVKGYLRQYGQRLGVDYQVLLALYHKQTKLEEVQIQPSPTIRLRDERQITVWIVATVVLAVIIVGLGVWWARGGRIDIASTAASVVAAVSPAAAVSTPAPATASPAATAPPAAAQSAPSPAPIEPPQAAPAVTDAAPALLTSAPVAPGDPPRNDVAAAAMTIPLELTFVQESWAEVTDARGERLFYGLGAARRQARMRGEPPFAIVIGNANVVQLLVDGEAYPIPTEGREGNLARFSVDIAEE